MPGRAQWLKFKAFQFRHGKIGMEQGRIPGIGPQQQAQAQKTIRQATPAGAVAMTPSWRALPASSLVSPEA